MRTIVAVALVAVASPAWAQVEADVGTQVDSGAWRLDESDRVFLISRQAATMAPMSFRVGTLDQLQAVQSLGTGYDAEIFGDFAPTSWLQLGLTVDYGTLGDLATQGLVAPAFYAQAQILRQETAGVNLAAAVNFKKIGFSGPTTTQPNDGEVEAQILADRRFGRFGVTANGVFGKSISAPDSDAELRLAAGYYLRENLLVGVDGIGRYDTSFDGGPQDGTRYWELTGGPMATWKVDRFTVSGLVGVAAPMHAPIGPTAGNSVGATGMLQLGYAP